MRLTLLLMVVLTIMFSSACGADKTAPVPAAGTPVASPSAAPGTDRRAYRNAHRYSRVIAHSGSGGHADRHRRSVAQSRTDANAGASYPGADPHPDGSCDSHRDTDANSCAGPDAHSHSYAYSCAHDNTHTGGDQVANHTAADNTSSPAPGAKAHPHDHCGRSPRGHPRLRPG